jgi:hypothetical protein
VKRSGLLILPIIVLLLLLFGRGCEGPEERIRRRFDELAHDFSRGRPSAIVGHFTDDFRDRPTGVGKAELRSVLSQMSFSDRTDTGEFRHRVRFPLDAWEVILDPADPAAAKVRCVAEFEELRREEWSAEWEITLRIDMRETDEGWQLSRSEHTTVAGSPWR